MLTDQEIAAVSEQWKRIWLAAARPKTGRGASPTSPTSSTMAVLIGRRARLADESESYAQRRARMCAHCHRRHVFADGRHNRSDAIYCSTTCRQAAYRLRFR